MSEDIRNNAPDQVAGNAADIDANRAIDQVNLTVEAYLGSAQIRISDLDTLTADSVIELSASLNQAVELRVNGVTIGHGELVAVDDKFGVKIHQIAK